MLLHIQYIDWKESYGYVNDVNLPKVVGMQMLPS